MPSNIQNYSDDYVTGDILRNVKKLIDDDVTGDTLRNVKVLIDACVAGSVKPHDVIDALKCQTLS